VPDKTAGENVGANAKPPAPPPPAQNGGPNKQAAPVQNGAKTPPPAQQAAPPTTTTAPPATGQAANTGGAGKVDGKQTAFDRRKAAIEKAKDVATLDKYRAVYSAPAELKTAENPNGNHTADEVRQLDEAYESRKKALAGDVPAGM
jgi:hypothetical protein